ncbi:MAG: HAMP domain-containing protein [Anaerolineaceae bacterium]|nr:MAG: HAMP domain-containing protein [Anaerolineaceae bacterium]
MGKLKEQMTKLNKVVHKIKLKQRIIIVNIICILIPLIVSHLYFMASYNRLRNDHSLTDINLSVFLKNNWQGLLFVMISIIISFVIIILFSNRYSSRLNAFKKLMHRTASGDFENLESIDGFDEINDLYNDLNTMINNIQHLISTVYEEQVQKEKLYSRQKDVEFKMLASQINPHFLYNTLETIRMKARSSNELEIEELVKMLAKIMRRNIQVGDKLVTLKSELELVEYYLRIQQYRFGERISYNIDVKCNIDFLKIMPLIIQPIVENAFIHGLETKEGKGEIRIVVNLTDRLIIHVIDNGRGMSESKLTEIIESLNDFNKLDRSHIGLNNVNQRIKLLYGDEYGLYIESRAGEGTSVRIELPEDITQ